MCRSNVIIRTAVALLVSWVGLPAKPQGVQGHYGGVALIRDEGAPLEFVQSVDVMICLGWTENSGYVGWVTLRRLFRNPNPGPSDPQLVDATAPFTFLDVHEDGISRMASLTAVSAPIRIPFCARFGPDGCLNPRTIERTISLSGDFTWSSSTPPSFRGTYIEDVSGLMFLPINFNGSLSMNYGRATRVESGMCRVGQ